MKKMLMFIVLAMSLFSVNLMAEGLMTTEFKTYTNLDQTFAGNLDYGAAILTNEYNALYKIENKNCISTETKFSSVVKIATLTNNFNGGKPYASAIFEQTKT